jgi:hypothetical protein
MKFTLPNGEYLEIYEFEFDGYRGIERRFGIKYKGHMRFHSSTHEEAIGLALVAQWMAKILHEENNALLRNKQPNESNEG